VVPDVVEGLGPEVIVVDVDGVVSGVVVGGGVVVGVVDVALMVVLDVGCGGSLVEGVVGVVDDVDADGSVEVVVLDGVDVCLAPSAEADSAVGLVMARATTKPPTIRFTSIPSHPTLYDHAGRESWSALTPASESRSARS
jgi:hypothetical protein